MHNMRIYFIYLLFNNIEQLQVTTIITLLIVTIQLFGIKEVGVKEMYFSRNRFVVPITLLYLWKTTRREILGIPTLVLALVKRTVSVLPIGLFVDFY